MIYQYRIFLDHGYDGVDWEVVYSNKKISKKEFQKIVNAAYNDPTRKRDSHEGTCTSVAEHIMKNHKDFFDIEFIASADL